MEGYDEERIIIREALYLVEASAYSYHDDILELGALETLMSPILVVL